MSLKYNALDCQCHPLVGTKRTGLITMVSVKQLNTNRIDYTGFIGSIQRLCSESLKLRKTVIACDLRDILKINPYRVHVARQDDVKVLGCLRGVAKSGVVIGVTPTE